MKTKTNQTPKKTNLKLKRKPMDSVRKSASVKPSKTFTGYKNLHKLNK